MTERAGLNLDGVIAARGVFSGARGAAGALFAALAARLVAWDGVEPPTRGFSVRCSTS